MGEPRDGIAIGIDAGGTKTLGVLVDAAGDELGRSRAQGANPWSSGRDAARLAIASVIEPLLSGARVQAVCLGSAGITRDGGHEAAEEDLRAIVPPGVVISVCTDAVAALGIVGSQRPAVVVIAGTGSIVYGERSDRSATRLGGHGALIGDAGSGAALGLAALRHTARALDRDAPRGPLSDAISVRLGLRRSGEVLERIGWPNFDIALVASLSPLVAQALEQGDDAARRIVETEARALAEDARYVATLVRTDAPLAAIFVGSILGVFRPIRDAVENALSETGLIALHENVEPALGAARLALDLLR
ncbi:MAG TPA: BadF/BadG/BcrA/BcrD ATPase family protein [Candidatus Eremiobacteraceae bacterium]|nr:BadF/BadG/BcrA/BcrD ATPase family protein [Candidatus Eremiobacteraceae bacterium]